MCVGESGEVGERGTDGHQDLKRYMDNYNS